MSYHFKLDHLSEVIECMHCGYVTFDERMRAISRRRCDFVRSWAP